jgi:hypothetical protein
VQLLFTEAQFFDVLAAYNTALWPAAAALWLMSLAAVVRLVRHASDAHREVSALLAVHWAWSAVAYHAAFFTRVNPAAWLFAGLFGLQAGLFVWFGIVHDRLRFTIEQSARHLVAALLVGYGLAYPFINLTLFEYPRVPTFGVPCPTTILTAGLLLAVKPVPATLIVVPVLWSFIAGSAAVLFGVTADFVLPIAGVVLLAVATLVTGFRAVRISAR